LGGKEGTFEGGERNPGAVGEGHHVGKDVAQAKERDHLAGWAQLLIELLANLEQLLYGSQEHHFVRLADDGSCLLAKRLYKVLEWEDWELGGPERGGEGRERLYPYKGLKSADVMLFTVNKVANEDQVGRQGGGGRSRHASASPRCAASPPKRLWGERLAKRLSSSGCCWDGRHLLKDPSDRKTNYARCTVKSVSGKQD